MCGYRNSELSYSFIMDLAGVGGQLFLDAYDKGYNMSNFAYNCLNSECGLRFFKGDSFVRWFNSLYILEYLEDECDLVKSDIDYSRDMAEYAGYLYKYMCLVTQLDPRDIWKIAPYDKVCRRYMAYHTQDFDYVVNHLLEEANRC